jgi:hypothetical protein
MKAAVISKYSSESLAGNSIELVGRVFPLEVRGVISRRFKVGNTAGEYTGCGSSPHCFPIVSSQRFLEVCMKRQSQKILSSPSLQLGKSSRPVLQTIWPDPALNCTVM